ncbi:DUF6236 family protein [Micromonospora sp. NPDC050495]|uniref:DUF6236 family protein n=1 Tax=Micromonospora sp. NPDC050495 TaxID=3154936 RepID=UPI0033CEB3E9
MSDIALYHPYVRFQDEAWLKGAVLYWPKIARLLPYSLPAPPDSATVLELRAALDCIVDVPIWPGDRHGSLTQVDELFYGFLDRHLAELRPRYGVQRLGIDPMLDNGPGRGGQVPRDPRLTAVHPDKMSWRLADRLADEGLLCRLDRLLPDGRRVRTGDLALHRDLGTLYLAVLADTVARANRMATVTDRPVTLATSGGWTIESMAAALLADAVPAPPAHPEPAQAFAVLALSVAVPGGLADVPVRRIVEARRHLHPELLAYRAYLDSLAPVLADLATVPDPAVRAAHLETMVEREIGDRLDATRKQLTKLGFEPARALLTTQTLVPPAALALLGGALELPPVMTGSGAVAVGVLGATAGMLGGRDQVRRNHPTGYLLGLRRELGAGDAVAAVRAAYRRATGQR